MARKNPVKNHKLCVCLFFHSLKKNKKINRQVAKIAKFPIAKKTKKRKKKNSSVLTTGRKFFVFFLPPLSKHMRVLCFCRCFLSLWWTRRCRRILLAQNCHFFSFDTLCVIVISQWPNEKRSLFYVWKIWRSSVRSNVWYAVWLTSFAWICFLRSRAPFEFLGFFWRRRRRCREGGVEKEDFSFQVWFRQIVILSFHPIYERHRPSNFIRRDSFFLAEENLIWGKEFY